MSLPFLLEIGTEEIPDWMIPGALDNMRQMFSDLLARNGLTCDNLRTDATPRRLVLRCDGLPVRQQDTEELVTGPGKTAPQQAVAGFAKKQGVPVEALSVQQTARGEYYGYVKKVAGRETKDILAEALPDLVVKIYFPKNMVWTATAADGSWFESPRFIRPVRWIVSLLGGGGVLPWSVSGVTASNVTRGHRQLGSSSITVDIAGYEQALRDNFVILSADERRQKILKEVEPLNAKVDPALLETLVYITEYPTAIRGDFDPQYLSLPAEILITVMKHHQKYFSVEENGKLAPHFVAVMNTSSDPEGLVKRGNERVLRARFNDARFFWDADQKKKLADRKQDLANVTFQAKLGSYLQKTDRNMKLVAELGGDANAVRAAELAKCDLTTELVKEFTELQGVVGGLYAKHQGENEEVATAVYDHYKPVSMEDSIPRTRTGQLMSLADKVDTLRGCFSIGMIPTGSKDPFALRRAAQGVVKILVEGKIELPLSTLTGNDAALQEFMLDRIRYYFKDVRGFKYDEVNAVLASGSENLPDVAQRLEALQAVRPTENFEPLAASFKRIRNILKQANFTESLEVNSSLLESGPEQDLYNEFSRVREQVSNQGYRDALATVATLRPKVDLFFDKVLVNAPDPAVRRNRFGFLHRILTEFSTIADFSEIVTNS